LYMKSVDFAPPQVGHYQLLATVVLSDYTTVGAAVGPKLRVIPLAGTYRSVLHVVFARQGEDDNKSWSSFMPPRSRDRRGRPHAPTSARGAARPAQSPRRSP